MINEQLINPKSIAIIGGSENLQKPGGKILHHILERYRGEVFVVNPKAENIQGVKVHQQIKDINEEIDLAVIAIAAKFCPEAVKKLVKNNNTRAFIIISAGFSEESATGAGYEKEITDTINNVNGCLIGPNCTGVITNNHQSYFTTPIPKLNPQGADFISSSGGTAVFIIETGTSMGLSFNNIFSVGNAPQTCVEDVLEYLDETFNEETSSKSKLIYIEDIKKPDKLLKHASSLVQKGCKIAAIKSGTSDAGKRAAESHTGAMASSDIAVDTLFKKAGIIRCHSRLELATMAAIFASPELVGNRMTIITHAGGPAVMLTDTLSNGGIEVPQLLGEDADDLKTKLFAGSSVKNPIDFLATGTAEQLSEIIDYCQYKFDNIDAICIVFGSSGLFDVENVYEVIHNKMRKCSKPIFAVLPSVENAKEAIGYFTSKGNVCFFDEVILASALTKVYPTSEVKYKGIEMKGVNIPSIKKMISKASTGILDADDCNKLLNYAGVASVPYQIIHSEADLKNINKELNFPIAAKVMGFAHKTEIDGIALNIKSTNELEEEYRRLSKIENAEGVILQPMLDGIELFVGAKYEPKFGHIMMIGLGGIYVEVLKDITSGLAPFCKQEVLEMLRELKAYPILQGFRGNKGINIDQFADIIVRISTMLRFSTEIVEMDLNPLIANEEGIFVVDAHIKIEK